MNGPHRLAGPAEISCDVLVIGSGAGGACVAEAATRASRSVLVLEEGPYVPHGEVPARMTDSMARLWRNGGLTAAIGTPPVAYVEGCCVGGGTEINSAIFQRTPPEIVETWARKYGITNLSPSSLAPYYDRVAGMVHASLTSGPLGEPSDVLLRGGKSMGWKVSPLERAQHHCVGTNHCAQGCPTGGKQSMTTAVWPDVLARGARLIAECRVSRLVIRKRRVVKVLATIRDPSGQTHAITVRPEHVFLCAGAIGTPSLLRRSGLNRNIGNNLGLHPMIKFTGIFDREMNAHRSRLPLYAITEFMPDERIGGSVFSPGLFAMGLAEDWPRRCHLAERWRRGGLYYAQVRGQGTGSVRNLPGVSTPLVRYRLAGEDWARLSRLVGKVGRAMFAAGAVEVIPNIAGHPGWRNPSECAEFDDRLIPQGRANLMTIHLFGTCPPGENIELTATDSYGRVRGIENLVVADASQIPEAPGVNPQATIMALALRSAETVLREPRRTSG